ncbi:DUF4236 domain-containing protein [Thiohalocapsa marina]|uniref:DUF4236 domain-containing protein n=2 Tax=Thiohalocapsa marina TaxID=424902 RepID=A0A5M8FFS8_9GAMM|nr:DUF4236 domain-containing protein [Thiohalocapsa marina]KAA6182596.1 DUF4236 domain-containing protein [Thiohalocapsa marina]
MGFRFWRRVTLAPGVSLNLSKSGASLSLVPRGAKYTIGPRGNRVTVGLPGTGLYYTVQEPRRRGGSKAASSQPVPAKDRLTLGFFQRLVTPPEEAAFVDGLRTLHAGDEAWALAQLEAATDLPDAAWTAGMLRLKRRELDEAHRHLHTALRGVDRLGALYAKYGVSADIELPVTAEVRAHIGPRERGTRLALAELHQLRDQPLLAELHLREVLAQVPDDVVVKAALAELLLAVEPLPDADAIVRLAAGVENDSAVHAALLLYKGRALMALGMVEQAVQTFTAAYRRKQGRPPALLRQIRYDRALAYRALGRHRDSRRELQAIYAEDPEFEDVAALLGLR